jgi:DnaJ-class molecular chaperone
MSIKKNDHPWEHKFKKPLERYVPCDECDGKGKTSFLIFLYKRCEKCNGGGKIRNKHVL